MVRLLVFFFASRRRHTRYWRDWSSDVCSSDLSKIGCCGDGGSALRNGPTVTVRESARGGARPWAAGPSLLSGPSARPGPVGWRSEEGRVGEEGRSRWSPDL